MSDVDGDAVFIDALLLSDAFEQLAGVAEPARSHLAAIQVVARRTGYAHTWPAAVDGVLMADDVPAGRLLLASTPDGMHIVDIRVHPDHRGHGVGTAALAELCAKADGAGVPITLTVAAGNPATRLYARVGFVRLATDAMHSADETWHRTPFVAGPSADALQTPTAPNVVSCDHGPTFHPPQETGPG